MICIKCKKEISDNSVYCNLCGKKQVTTQNKRSRGNGLGTVFKDGNSWTAEYTFDFSVDENGKIKRNRKRKRGFITKKEALLYLQSITEKQEVITVKDLFSIFRDGEMQKLVEKVQARHLLSYKKIEIIHNKKITDITLIDLQNLIDKESYYNARFIKDTLSKIYKYAIVQNYVQTNLALYLSLPTNRNKKATDKFTTDDLLKMQKAFDNGELFFGYILVMVYTGIMPSEIMKLKPNMIDYENHSIIGCNSEKTQLRENTVITFPDKIVPILNKMCENKKEDLRLFNKRPETFYATFRRLRSKYNLSPTVTPYSARRTTATMLAELNLPPAVIANIMRHKTYATTLKYYTKIENTEALNGLNLL